MVSIINAQAAPATPQNDDLWNAYVLPAITSFGQQMESGWNELLQSDSFLAVGPLVTINAVAVAVALFALETRIRHSGERAKSVADRQRKGLVIWGLNTMIVCGLVNLAAMLYVLADRTPCEHVCLASDGDHAVDLTNAYLANATILTLFSVVFLIAALFLIAFSYVSIHGGEEPETSILA